MAGEKRTQDNEESLIKENVIIVDIEGTTTSITFVKEKLFPYVRDNVEKYVNEKWEDQEFKRDLEKLKEQAKKDQEDKAEGLVPISGSTIDEEKESLVKNVLWQMDGDRKTGALKQLQGHMWREAYESGNIKGHVYADVPECLKSWKNSGKKTYVYSSGSVEAQKMLFKHSDHGDLLEYFSGYFDTEVGPKQEAASYKNILNQIKAEATDVIFLTDIVKEAKAAKEAGFSSIIMIREGNAPLTAEERVEFRTAKSFLDLTFVSPAKRQKLETPEESKKPAAGEPSPEKMDTSEAVEMTDVSDKESKSKVESNDKKADAGGSEDVGAEKALASETVLEKDEAMETDGKTVNAVRKVDETKPVEEPKKKETVESEKEESKSEETVETVDKEGEAGQKKQEENVEKSNADETDKVIIADSKNAEISEKSVEVSEKKAEPAKAEADEAMEETPQTVQEPKAAAKVAEAKTETKTEGSDNKSEPATNAKLEAQTEKTKSDIEAIPKAKEVEKTEPKEGEKLALESEKITKPKSDEAIKTDERSVNKETVTENGTAKIDETSKTDNEVKEKAEKKEAPSEVKKSEETVAEGKESSEKKNKEEESKVGEVAAAKKEAEAKDVDLAKSAEEKKECGKTETAEVSKDPSASAVVEPVKKLNGTTQNGDSAKSDDNKKIHTNGVNEACTSESADTKKNTEASSQNREPESSTDASAESIKVKKVVDSTAADGAGEPDVAPTVAVAATS